MSDQQAPKRMANDAELKQVVQTVADLAQLGSDLTGGLSFSELGDLLKVGQDIPVLLKDASILWPEYAQLDDAARADLEAYVSANVSFPASTTVQVVLQNILDAAIALSKVIQLIGIK